MNEKQNIIADALSEIDDEVVERVAKKREELSRKAAMPQPAPTKEKRKIPKTFYALGSLAAALIIAVVAIILISKNPPTTAPTPNIPNTEIISINKVSTEGSVEKYEITYEDGRKATFEIHDETVRKDDDITGLTVNEKGEFLITFGSGATLNMGDAIGFVDEGSSENSVCAVSADSEGNLSYTLGNDKTVGLGKANGHYKHDDGVGLISATVSQYGDLLLGLSSGEIINVGSVVGKKGEDGKDGVGIEGISISEKGELTIALTNGTSVNLGVIKGEDGIGIAKSEINENGELILTYTDGTVVNLGKVVGERGEDGVGIENIAIDRNSNLVITLTDGKIIDLGSIKGADGADGADGKSAYELYVEKYGYEGTEEEWLFDLVNGNLAALIEYEVSFDLNGGTGEAPTQKVQSGYKATSPVDPTRDGHVFLGWFIGDEQWSFSGYSVTENITLVAKWEKLTYPVSFDLAGGIGSASTQLVEPGGSVARPKDPTRDNYIFVGWFNGDTLWNFDTDTVNAPLTLTAVWSTVTYTVEFDLAGGSSDTIKAQTVAGGGRVTKPEDPERIGYTFAGWYIADEPWSFVGNTVLEDITIQARWNVIEYSITYDLEFGIADNPLIYTINDSFTLSNPRRDYYDFIGWTFEGQSEPKMVAKITEGTTGDKHFKANYTPTKYPIGYNLNGGSVFSTLPSTYTKFETVTLENPTKADYVFTGWSINGSSQTTTDLSISGAELSGEVIFTATFAPKTYKITYDLGVMNNLSDIALPPYDLDASYDAISDKAIFDPTYGVNASDQVLVFLGWTWRGDDTPTKNIIIEKGSYREDLTFTSHWETVEVAYSPIDGYTDPEMPYEASTHTGIDLIADGSSDVYSVFDGVIKSISGADGSYTVVITAENGILNAYYSNIESLTDGLTVGSAVTGGEVIATLSDTPTYSTEAGLSSRLHFGFILYNSSGDAVYSDPALHLDAETKEYILGGKISYELLGGTLLSSVTSYSQRKGVEISLTPTRLYHTFLGWTYEGVSEPQMTPVIEPYSGDLTLTAVWELNKYNVSFVTNGGEPLESLMLEYGTTDLPTPIREGYTFGGWYLEAGLRNEVLAVPGRAITLYAYWTEETLTKYLKYELGEGEATIVGTKDANNLTSLVLPEYIGGLPVTTIDDLSGAGRAKRLTIPKTVTKISDGAIHIIPTIADGNTSFKVQNGNLLSYDGERLILADTSGLDMDEAGLIDYTVPDGIKILSAGALPAVNTLTLSKDIATINDGALDNVRNIVVASGNTSFKMVNELLLSYDGKRLIRSNELGYESLVIPETVEIIEDRAIRGGITSVTIPNSVKEITKNPFSDCYALTSVILEDGNQAIKMDGSALYSADGKTLLLYVGTARSFTVPEGVEVIAAGAFKNETALSSITLPSTLKVIGDYAFYGTFELHEFDLPASLEEIGSYAFAENDGLYEINIPESVTRIGSYAFYRCYSISVSFAKSGALKEIEHHAFSDCYMLEKIILPEGLEILGDFAFANCDTLLSLHLPSTLREIGEGAISTYYYSSEITIADGNEYFKVTDASLYSADGKILYLAAMNSKYEFKVIDGCEVINAYAFYKVSPHTLYLPKSVKLIGEHAFESCNEFYTLYYEGNEEDWDGIVIGDYNSSLDSLEVTFNTY